MKKNKFRAMFVALCLLLAACGLLRPSDTPPHRAAVTAPVQLRGVNLPGAEMWYGHTATDNPVSGKDYLFVSHQDIDYLASKGVNFVRLLFSWEALQPTPNAPFPVTGNNGTYVSTFIDRVNYATSKGITVMVEPHGAESTAFAKYKGNYIGSSAVPNSQFADLWVRMATQFKSNPKVVFGLMNEPNGMSTVQWFNGAQAAITGIRATGATNMIMVEGNGWSAAESWTSNWYDTASTKISNASAWKSIINDPLNNTVAEVHMYFDADAGGTANDIVSPTIGVERTKVTVDWARANNVKVHLSEFGANVNAPNARLAVTNLLTYLDANKDVVIGWSWWAYGPPAWWSGNTFTLNPTSNYTVDDPKMAWIKPFFVVPTPPIVDASVPDVSSPPPPSTFPSAPIAFTKDTVISLTTGGITSSAYVPSSYDSTHNTPTKLLVWLHGCGGVASGDVWTISPGGKQSWISLAVGGRDNACWSSLSTDGPKILAAIADIKTHFNIDPKRVVLGGYSSGGDIGYPLIFANANMFAGALFENTGPSSAALTASKTAAWKLNIVHLAHLQDTTYPIASVRSSMATLTANGFPVTLIERPGTHWDADNGQTGTDYDNRTFLLPYMDAGWTVGTVTSPLDAGTSVNDAGVDSGRVDAGVADAGVDSGSDAGTLLPFTVTATKTYDWGTGYCKQYYFTNPNTVSRNWKTMTIYFNDGKLRGPSAVWGAVFPNSSATGKVVVTPSGNATVKAGQKLQTVGFCADYGPTKYVATSGGLTY